MNSDKPDGLETRPTLINRIHDLRNEDAWFEFVSLYRPLIVRFSQGQKVRVSPEDAEDIAQKTLAWVADKIEDFEYRPDVCSFRSWLLQKVRYLILDRFREINKRALVSSQPGSEASVDLEQVADPKTLDWEKQWEEEHRRAIVEAASQIVRRRENPKNFQIYELYKVQGLEPAQVAEKLGVTEEHVYLAAHRVKTKLKAAVERLRKSYEEPVFR